MRISIDSELMSRRTKARWTSRSDPTVADSILDRLVDDGHRFDLKGEKIRSPAIEPGTTEIKAPEPLIPGAIISIDSELMSHRTKARWTGRGDPTVQAPHAPQVTISEGDTISFADLATFTDPGLRAHELFSPDRGAVRRRTWRYSAAGVVAVVALVGAGIAWRISTQGREAFMDAVAAKYRSTAAQGQSYFRELLKRAKF